MNFSLFSLCSHLASDKSSIVDLLHEDGIEVAFFVYIFRLRMKNGFGATTTSRRRKDVICGLPGHSPVV